MADSDTLRKRRYRHHKAGDHGLCIPGRCKALEATDEVLEPSTSAGARLWSALAAEYGELPPLCRPMAVEACRIADRLDTLDRQLAGHDWLRFRHDETGVEVTVYVDRVLSEAREQAVAYKAIAAELAKALPKPADKSKGGGKLASVLSLVPTAR